MLQQAISADDLNRQLLSQDAWQPFPRASRRQAWQELPAAIRENYRQRAETALTKEWPQLPATLYLEYARIGNRSNFQEPNAVRRHLLLDLVLGECVAGDGRFLDRIADGIWLICEESTWCLPAHVGGQQAGVGLPDVTEPILDLFAGETGSLLAWTSYLLGEPLDTVSPLLRKRIHHEINRRILSPFLDRDDSWWMGFGGNRVNNWNPWINSNVLTCGLLLEPDPKRRVAIVSKALRSVDNFVDPYPRDGGCDEGPGYWSRAGASLFDCLEILHSATNGAIDLFGEPLVKEIGRFIYRVHIDNKWFVNFADAPARLMPDGALVCRYGRAIGDPMMQEFGAWCADQSKVMERGGGGALSRILPTLFGLQELAAARPVAPALRDVWLPHIQVMLARDEQGSSKGLTLAAKGGHNDESHNHNDVGHFVIYANGRPLLIDVGVEDYRRQTFSAERYQIWTMQSLYHNLPAVDNIQQLPGRKRAATAVVYAADDQEASLQVELADTYSSDSGITSWQRRITFVRGCEVRLTDQFQLAAAPQEVLLNFMTPCRIKLGKGQVLLKARRLPQEELSGTGRISFDADLLTARFEEIPLTDHKLAGIWGDSVYRIQLVLKTPTSSGVIQTTISK